MYHPPIFTSVNHGHHEDASNIDLNELFSDAEMLLFAQHVSHFDDDQVPAQPCFRLPSKMKYSLHKPGILNHVVSGGHIEPVPVRDTVVSSTKVELRAVTTHKQRSEAFAAVPQAPVENSSNPGAICVRIPVDEQVPNEMANPLSNTERRERNREHAKRSRIRKKFLLESLQDQVIPNISFLISDRV